MSLNLKAFIIDPDSSSRLMLRQVMTTIPDFKTVLQFSSPAEALNSFNSSSAVDVVFISYTIGKQIVKNFIQQAKNTQAGQDTAYVVILQSQAEGKALLAEIMMDGGDGILCKPFSVEQLREITHISLRVKKERFESREKAALSLLVPEIAKQLDLVCSIKLSGIQPDSSFKVLREQCQKIIQRGEASFEIYANILKSHLKTVPPPPPLAQSFKVYSGASRRLKAKMEKKILEKFADTNLNRD